MIICVPSAGRAHHVGAFAHPPEALWFVPEDEAWEYELAGANVVPGGSREGAAVVRNAILDYACSSGWDYVAMLDDDLRKVERVTVLEEEKNLKTEIGVREALDTMKTRLWAANLGLIGAAPTTNAFFTQRVTSRNLFAKSGAWVVRVSDLRLDTGLRVKEDYDFNLQNYLNFGGWLRADDLLFHFQQRTVTGGCAPLREDGADADAVEYLLHKWPGLVRKHSTRENEVTLTVPKS